MKGSYQDLDFKYNQDGHCQMEGKLLGQSNLNSLRNILSLSISSNFQIAFLFQGEDGPELNMIWLCFSLQIDKNIEETLWNNLTKIASILKSIREIRAIYRKCPSTNLALAFSIISQTLKTSSQQQCVTSSILEFSLHLFLPAYQPSSHHQTCLQHRHLSFPKLVWVICGGV